jgi:hypothetical protein
MDKKAQRSLASAVRSGQPSTVTCVKIKKQFINVSGTTKIMRINETASEINISHGMKRRKVQTFYSDGMRQN